MKNLDKIGEDLFNKIRGRFPNVTIGDEEGNVTNVSSMSRFFDFKFIADGINLGNVSISLDEDNGVTVLYSNDIVANKDNATKNNWYNFLKELRFFSKKRLLNFDTRDITKSNLNKRDYKFLAANKAGEDGMNETKLYGTGRVSYQDIDNARLVIKHSESVNAESPTGRTQKISSIFVDNSQGERFKYPYKHLTGARAMARHVAEGGNPHDDFGKHIIGLSEELSKLRKFKNYMGRSAVMAESLAGYMDVVKERVATVKKTIESLQKKSFYAEAFKCFEVPVFEEVPTNVAENWIDELTIRQFNEELKDVFPYIYKLISENTRAKELSPLDLEGYSVYEVGLEEEDFDLDEHSKSSYEQELVNGFENMMGQFSETENPTPTQMSDQDLADYIGASVEEVKADRDAAEEAANDISRDHAVEDETNEEKKKGSHGKVCWKGYRRGKGNDCHKVGEDDTDEGNAFAHAVRQAKMNGKKKGDKIDGPNGDEITLEKEQKTPLGEFILSHFDRETGQFPKGETAVLTMVEKDYGNEYIEPAKQFIEQVYAVTEQYREPEQSPAMERMRELAGLR